MRPGEGKEQGGKGEIKNVMWDVKIFSMERLDKPGYVMEVYIERFLFALFFSRVITII